MTNIKRTYYSNGQIASEVWVQDKKIHRTDGPAIIFYYERSNDY